MNEYQQEGNRMAARPLCWEGTEDDALPGCGGCIHSALRRPEKTSGSDADSECVRRYERIYGIRNRRADYFRARYQRGLLKSEEAH